MLWLLASILDCAYSAATLVAASASPASIGGNGNLDSYYARDTFSSTEYRMFFVLQSENGGGNKITVYNSNGISYTSISRSKNGVKSPAILYKPVAQKAFVIYEDQTYDVVQVGASGPSTLTLTAGSFTQPQAGFITIAATQTQDSNHVFILCNSGASFEIFKFDYLMLIYNQGAQRSGDLGITSSSPKIKFIGSEFMFFTDSNDRWIIVEKMGLYKVIDRPSSPIGDVFVQDAHKENRLFHAADGSPFQVTASQLGIGAISLVDQASASQSEAIDVGLLNVGTYQYLLGIKSSPQKFIVLKKIDLAIYGIEMPYTNSVTLHSAIGSDLSASGTMFEFSLFNDNNPRKVYFFGIIFELCDSRDTSRVCQSCPAGYFRNSLLPDNYCLPIANFLPGYGPDIIHNLMLRCQSKGCKTCTAVSFDVCDICDNSAGFYLYNGNCYIPPELPIKKGIQSPNVNNCPLGCVLCFYDSTKCTKCDDSADFYLDPATSLCVLKSNIPVNKGANIITGEVASCSSGCQECRNDVFYCTVCNSGYFLTPNKVCLSNSQLPAGYRINPATGEIQACADGCKSCPPGPSTCDACFITNNYVLSGSKCVLMNLLPDGTGANLVTGVTNPCGVPNCQKCRFDATKCETCFPKYNLDTLTFKSCTSDVVTTFLQLVARENPSPGSKVDVSFYISVDPPITPASENSAILALIQAKLLYTIKIIDSNGVEEVSPFKTALTLTSGFIQLDITFPTPLKKVGNYEIQLGSTESFPFDYKTTSYQVLSWSGSTTYKNDVSSSDLQEASSQADSLGSLTPPTSTSSASVTFAMFAVISADPTGLLMRVSQILQVVSKLAFINVNYGQRLESFLSKIGEMFEGYKNPGDASYVLHTKLSRGKLSRYGVQIDLLSKYALRLGAYLTCWLFKFMVAAVPYDMKLPKWTLHVMFYIPKVHSLIFNLVFFDLTFYASRTLLHSRDLAWSSLLGAVSLILLALDFATLFGKILDNSAWRKLYFHLRQGEPLEGIYSMGPSEKEKKEHEEERERFDTAMKDVPEEFMTSEESESEQDFQHRTSRSVDYIKTYTEINFDYHMYDFMSEFLRVDRAVFASVGARSYYAFHVFRIGLYHAIVVCGQYMSTTVVSMLVAVEVSKIVYTFYYHFKLKYLKFLVLILVEISQSVMFGSFLVMVLYFHGRDTDVELTSSTQTVGIYLVVMSVATEYVLLIVYAVFMLIHSFRSAKLAKEYRRRKNYVLGVSHPKKIKFAYIHYLSRHKFQEDYLSKTIYVREIAQKNKPGDSTIDSMNKSIDADSSMQAMAQSKPEVFIEQPIKRPTRTISKVPVRTVSRDVSINELGASSMFTEEKTINNHLRNLVVPATKNFKPQQIGSEQRNLSYSSNGKTGAVPAYLQEAGDSSLSHPSKKVFGSKGIKGAVQVQNLTKKFAASNQPRTNESTIQESTPVRRQFQLEINDSEQNRY